MEKARREWQQRLNKKKRVEETGKEERRREYCGFEYHPLSQKTNQRTRQLKNLNLEDPKNFSKW